MKLAFRALYNTLQTVYKNSKATLKNVVVILFVFGLEQIFEKGIFKCPATNYGVYGNLFMFGPAVCLFNLTLLLHNTFWDVITGCRHAHFNRRWVCKNVARVTFQAILPAGVWIVMSLIQTHYYVCAKLGPKEVALKKAYDADSTEEIENKYAKAEAESQILAWFLFDSLIIIASLVVCARRCCFLQAEGSLPNIHDYEKIEADAAVSEFKVQMEKQAKEEGERYVQSLFKEVAEDKGDAYSTVVCVQNKLAEKYPRATGNLSKPFRQQEKNASEVDGGADLQHKLLNGGVKHDKTADTPV